MLSSQWHYIPIYCILAQVLHKQWRGQKWIMSEREIGSSSVPFLFPSSMTTFALCGLEVSHHALWKSSLGVTCYDTRGWLPWREMEEECMRLSGGWVRLGREEEGEIAVGIQCMREEKLSKNRFLFLLLIWKSPERNGNISGITS